MIVVTGAAGFIGSCIVAKLNELRRNDLILVDHMEDDKRPNLANKKFQDYYEKQEFLELIKRDSLKKGIEGIIHMGACSSTTCQDAEYFRSNNLEYTKILARWALDHKARFIYASSAATYGDGSLGYKDDDETIKRCQPLNLYGQSKQDFDLWALREGVLDRIVGLKFFNVFGPNEYHKGDMRSVVAKSFQKVAGEGEMNLFRSYNPGCGDGEQRRDFIYVKDAVDVAMFFLKHPKVNGIFNVGTGQSRSWNDLAHALFAAVGKDVSINYIDMPEQLRNRYQYFTEADMSKLKKSGYRKAFTGLEVAVKDYASYLKDNAYI